MALTRSPLPDGRGGPKRDARRWQRRPTGDLTQWIWKKRIQRAHTASGGWRRRAARGMRRAARCDGRTDGVATPPLAAKRADGSGPPSGCHWGPATPWRMGMMGWTEYGAITEVLTHYVLSFFYIYARVLVFVLCFSISCIWHHDSVFSEWRHRVFVAGLAMSHLWCLTR